MPRTARPSDRRAPAQWGSVRPLPSGRFQAFYRFEGRRVVAPETFATRDAARGWLAAERADRDRGVWRDPDAERVTLADYAHDWLASRLAISPRTREGYARILERWLLAPIGGPRAVALGDRFVSDITPAHVRTWYAAVHATARDAAAKREAAGPLRHAHPARAWGRAHGFEVADSGRMSPALLSAWRVAGSPVPAPLRKAGTLSPDDSGRLAAAQAYRVLRTIMNEAVRDDVIAATPCRMPGGGVTRHAERPVLTAAEVAALAQAIAPRFRAAVLVTAWGALRYGEVFALARRHVDLEAGTVRVERALECVAGQPIRIGKPKTAKSTRTVHLPAFVMDALRVHLAEFTAAEPDALVFTTTTGRPVPGSRVSVAMQRAREAIGRDDVRFHDLRHTGATLAYRAGASVPEVQARLGHTTMRAATIYAHAVSDSDRLIAERFDAMFGNAA